MNKKSKIRMERYKAIDRSRSPLRSSRLAQELSPFDNRKKSGDFTLPMIDFKKTSIKERVIAS